MKAGHVLTILVLMFGAYYLGTVKNTKQGIETPTVLAQDNATGATPKPTRVSEITEEAPAIEKAGEKTRIISAEAATIEIFDQAAPSVCYITTSNLRRDYWSRNIQEIPAGSGSGFIWDKSGHIVTNYHVIRNASKATVTLSDRQTYEATLVGVEPNKDLAVLKINVPASKLKPIPRGNSDKLRVGQYVFAIGNPFGLDQTLTTGVISALGREIQSLTGRPIRDVIQTDAAINPGNSGGPLLDSQGDLIGVNTQIYSPSGASAGIGFSIPVDEVKWVVPDLIKYGEVKRPILGVSLLPAQYARDFGIEKGVMVADVVKGGPSEKAGIRPIERSADGSFINGDIIVAIQGQSVNSFNDLVLALERYQVGERISVELIRSGKKLVKTVELAQGG